MFVEDQVTSVCRGSNPLLWYLATEERLKQIYFVENFFFFSAKLKPRSKPFVVDKKPFFFDKELSTFVKLKVVKG